MGRRQMARYADETGTRISRDYYERVCTGCGTIYQPGKNCRVVCWLRHRLRRAVKGGFGFGRGLGCGVVWASSWPIQKDKKNQKDKKCHMYVLVFRCDHCQTHTVFDTHAFGRNINGMSVDGTVSSEKATTVLEMPKETVLAKPKMILEKPKMVLSEDKKSKNLQRFLQQKRAKTSSSASSPSDLDSFLLDLHHQKHKK